MEFIGNMSVLSTLKGGTDIPVGGGHIFGYCLSQGDIASLKELAVGGPMEFVRKDGSKGKRLSLGYVRVNLVQVDEMDGTDVEGRDVKVPIFRIEGRPERAEDISSKAFFG